MMPAQLVVGTAGHIDHGKSALVRALTGVDPDRLPEEKARGMSIDLGFAHARVGDADLWFVDVPGHERFIRNMVAGATGVDVALLIVAADDAVMPQTREHAELLSLLGISRCLLVLTKLDLVDETWAAQVEDEARGLLREVGLTPIDCIWTSVQTGRGLEALRARLAELAQAPRPAAGYSWFRLPIDRAFTIAGRGTVVTGSVLHGGVQREEELELWPARRTVRVRDLQTHNDPRASATGRMRLAVNLAGVALEDVARGCELATPGYLSASVCLNVWLHRLRTLGARPRQRLRIRLHLATNEVLAELHMPHAPPTAAMGDLPAQLRLAAPVVATWGQRFILRDESGQHTLGGGAVLTPSATRWSRRHPADPTALERLHRGAPAERAAQLALLSGWELPPPPRYAAQVGLTDASAAEAVIASLVQRGDVTPLGGGSPVLVATASLRELATDVLRRMEQRQTVNPRWAGVPVAELPAWLPRDCPARLRPALADWLARQPQLRVVGGHVRPAGQGTTMPPADLALLEAALREIHAGAFTPPDVLGLSCRTPRNEARLRELIRLAETEGRLVRIAEGIWLHADRHAELLERVRAALRSNGPQTVAQIRSLLGTTRKYAVPICEHLDALGVTRRRGDLRVLGS